MTEERSVGESEYERKTRHCVCVCVCMGVCLCANNMFLMFLPVTDEYFILSLFKTRHSQLAMNKSHLSALFSDALSKLNTKLGIPLRSQE